MDDKPITFDAPGDVQDVVVASHTTYIKPQGRKPHDPNISFEEYHWYAQRTREEEKNYEPPKLAWRELLFHKKNGEGKAETRADPSSPPTGTDSGDASHRLEISDEEWSNASRMFRTASWGAGRLM